MPNTTNFNWATPADTDLVKDGAAAIRTLGNSIDSSFVDLKGGTTGQILSKASNTDLDYTWIANDQGDITEVQAGTGISVASGTGPVPVVTNSMATEITAKGDLIVGTGSGTFDNLPAGTNGYTLVADSVETTGLKWVAPAGGTKSFTLLNTGGTALTGNNNITISSITGQDALWVVVVDASSANASSTIGVRFNSDTGTNYRQAGMQNETANPLNYNIVNIFGGDETRIALGLMSTSTSSRICGAVSVWGATSTNPKAYVSTGGGEGAGATYTHRSYVGQGMYLGTSAISSVTINSSTGNFDNGTVYVYGSA